MILTTIVAAVALGIAGQIVADRFHLPAILPLLVLGISFGAAGIGIVHPEALGATLEPLIHLGVAIILFEGGLSLDLNRLARVGAPVRNLLSIGVAITGLGAAWLAHSLVDMPWAGAALFGAVMVVTGPTVIAPLLRHMIAPREVKTVLLSEGLMVDPIGAALAYLVLQWIHLAGIPPRALIGELLILVATGAVIGFAAGALTKGIIRSRVVSGELRNLAILALLMVCYLVAERQAPQSGLLAAMVMGLTVSAAELPDLTSVKAFKGQLTTLTISVLFILLAAQLDLDAIAELEWRGALVVTGLILIVRPLAVALSIWPHHLDWRGRLMVALSAPRGIVAAALASLAAMELGKAGVAGGAAMEGLTYLAIIATGAWSTVVALFLPRLLGYTKDPSRRRIVLVGANALTETIADLLESDDSTTVVVDGVSWRLDGFRAKGIATVCGDARDAVTYEEAAVERDSVVLAGTTNDELNLLVAELVRSEFGVEHPVVALQRPPEDLGRRSRAWIDLFGGRSFDVPTWIRRLENRTAQLLSVDLRGSEAMALLRQVERESPEGVARLTGHRQDQVRLRVGDDHLDNLDLLTILAAEGRPMELLSPMAAPTEDGRTPTSKQGNHG
ncbi:MAG: cation:proton antiporter [Thermoanaerobaculales bacterium]